MALSSQVTEDKQTQFTQLFQEFAATYPATPDGQKHIEWYEQSREQGRQNFEKVVAAAGRGEDITDPVLLKLLPYNDTPNNREKGAWTHLAPTINGDIKKWFKGAGWTKPQDWPRVAQAILELVRRCSENPMNCKLPVKRSTTFPTPRGSRPGC